MHVLTREEIAQLHSSAVVLGVHAPILAGDIRRSGEMEFCATGAVIVQDI